MRAMLCQFVHNGVVLRRDVVRPLLKRLYSLHRVLAELHTYRFYSSSLLLMYDGGDWEQEGEDGMSQPCNQCQDQSSQHNSHEEPESQMQCDSNEEQEKHWNAPPCPHTKPPKVDIRMIDFAHVTHEGFRGDKIIHEGPDHGYLFGLENLIQMFENILEHGAHGLELLPVPESTTTTTGNNGQVASTSYATTPK